MDQHFRLVEELFRPETFAALSDLCEIEGAQNEPMSKERIDQRIDEVSFLVAAFPGLNASQIERAKNLKATIEVAGAFSEGLDYQACFDKKIEVLSCSPGFRQSVAEMTLAMALAGGRGLVREHEAFRAGQEHWLEDCSDTDFTLFGADIGFIGFGQIAKETVRLMAPFAPKIRAYDPYPGPENNDVEFCSLDQLVEKSRIVIVAAVPSDETRNILSADLIAKLQKSSLVILISRAWCADFPALLAAANAKKITLATDVFPTEPLPEDDELRKMQNTILSPHRAAAVPGGRHLIGDMIYHDIKAILDGRPERQLKPVNPAQVSSLISAQKELPPVG